LGPTEKLKLETQATTPQPIETPARKNKLRSAHHVGRAKAFGALLALELDGLALVQSFITLFLNRGKVDKDILSARPLNETVSLCPIEPFHNALFLH
jgi:hypothetical protein